ncbi:MAG TPA: GNAT family N-acetyltransferase [Planktothrix sp.]|jgi:GNAT superfamily N-acetyltransferase
MPEQTKVVLDAKTQVHIRSAQASDGARLVSLCDQLGYPVTLEQIVTRVARIDQDPTRVLFVSVDESDRACGFIDLDHRVIAVCDYAVEICGLVTDESVRGQGHGAALVRHAEEWARGRGATEVSVRSNVVRKEAHGFYQRRGYEIFKQSYAFKKKI